MFGTGIEYLIIPNWSAKLEYNFVDLGTKDRTLDAFSSAPFSITERLHVVKFGLNYHLTGF
jgi:opacity protein-like surface antigen